MTPLGAKKQKEHCAPSLSSRWPSLPQVSSQPSPKLLHQDVFRCLFTLCHLLLHMKPILNHSGKPWGVFCDHRGAHKGQHVAPGGTCLGPRLVQECPWSPRSETHSFSLSRVMVEGAVQETGQLQNALQRLAASPSDGM